MSKLFECRAMVLEYEARQRLIEKEIELEKLRQKTYELEDGPVSNKECRRLLHGFMLDCNFVGLEQAAKNLHKGLKQAANSVRDQS